MNRIVIEILSGALLLSVLWYFASSYYELKAKVETLTNATRGSDIARNELIEDLHKSNVDLNNRFYLNSLKIKSQKSLYDQKINIRELCEQDNGIDCIKY